MSKKSRRSLRAKTVKKLFRRNGSVIGLAALAVSGLAAAVMHPKLRKQARQLKNRIVAGLEERRARRVRGLANGAVVDHDLHAD